MRVGAECEYKINADNVIKQLPIEESEKDMGS